MVSEKGNLKVPHIGLIPQFTIACAKQAMREVVYFSSYSLRISALYLFRGEHFPCFHVNVLHFFVFVLRVRKIQVFVSLTPNSLMSRRNSLSQDGNFVVQ